MGTGSWCPSLQCQPTEHCPWRIGWGSDLYAGNGAGHQLAHARPRSTLCCPQPAAVPQQAREALPLPGICRD